MLQAEEYGLRLLEERPSLREYLLRETVFGWQWKSSTAAQSTDSYHVPVPPGKANGPHAPAP